MGSVMGASEGRLIRGSRQPQSGIDSAGPPLPREARLEPRVFPGSFALLIQTVGIALIAVLSFFLTRSIRRVYLDYWSAAWATLAASLAALSVAYRFPATRPLSERFYYLGEYAFGVLLIAGCENYARGAKLGRRSLVAASPLVLVAAALPTIPSGFFVRFIPHAALLATLFGLAFWRLEKARRPETEGPGLRLMSVALLALSLNFALYVPIFSYATALGVRLPFAYTAYTSLYDLILETFLGFGTVVLVMEDVRREVEQANRELRLARDRLESLARLDPLTESLNRHAFYSLVEKNRDSPPPSPEGCVALVDIDSLKPINDSFGHASGDEAIRAVSRAIRSVVRADDLVFRWGGDEFLVVLFGVSETEARRRFEDLNAGLARVSVSGSKEPIAVTVSCGIAPFGNGIGLEAAIDVADDAMYRRKQSRRRSAAAEG